MSKKYTWKNKPHLRLFACGILALSPSLLLADGYGSYIKPKPSKEIIGEAPALPMHMDQTAIDNKKYSLQELKLFGRFLMEVDFNKLDGWGDPRRDRSPGAKARGDGVGGLPLDPGGKEVDFSMLLGPDTTACVECHQKVNDDEGRNIFVVGGAGNFKANVLSKAKNAENNMSMNPDLLDEDTGFILTDPPTIDRAINYRNTNHVFGSGAKEQLGKEMSKDLQSIRDKAIAKAAQQGSAVTLSLDTKGVNFGSITALPDGSVDTSGVEGVEPVDLIVRPFGLNGSYDTVRNFTTFAPTDFHFGLPTQEEYGIGTDPDGDGITDELTFGDMTAIALFQLSRPIPIEKTTYANRKAVKNGRKIFTDIGCASCHTPTLELDSTVLEVPSKINPGKSVTIDLASSDVSAPRIKRDGKVRIYSDLKRHQMGAVLREQRNGSSAKPNPPEGESFEPLPRGVFLTAPLWGIHGSFPWGHDGQYTLLSEIITAHGEDDPPPVGDPWRSEAQESRDAFLALSDRQEDELVEFLNSLTFDTDRMAIMEIVERKRFDRFMRKINK